MNFFEGFDHSETKNHLKRVEEYTKLLMESHEKRSGESFSLNYKNAVVKASVVHDIGKASIPERILYKPGPLSEHEKIIIETHPITGLYMLERFIEDKDNYYEVTKNIVLYHHERYDGGGYPYKLKGEKIPFEARLLAIVDTFDALTTERTYKEPWSIEKAVTYIFEQSGKQFDPHLVSSFVVLKEELDSI